MKKNTCVKQRNLPEGFKKSIIAKKKKSKGNVEDTKDDKKDDKVEDKKTIDKNKSDEENYLTAKQRKLPEGLKQSIIKKAKKKK